jgi:hypothetical protein
MITSFFGNLDEFDLGLIIGLGDLLYYDYGYS